MLLLSELSYCPPIPFFSQLLGADGLLLDAHEHYRKQTYRNRCLIGTAQGVQALTVPVVAGGRAAKVRTFDIAIDYTENWPHRHFRTLQTAYGSSPYFDYYADYLHDIYVEKPVQLFDLNLRLLELLLRCLRLPLPISFTTQYLPPGADGSVDLLDYRDCLTPKTGRPAPVPDSPADSAVSAGPRAYPQVFGPGFEPGLSVLDLLFSQGPAAGQFLH